jgi:serine/threonine-protein kinase
MLDPIVPFVHLGPFQLIELIRDGPIDAVYKTIDPKLNRYDALKLPLALQSTTIEDRHDFIQLARELATIDHPTILRLDTLGVFEGIPFMGTGLGVCISLQDLIVTRSLSMGQSITLIGAIAKALHLADTRWGLVHGDLNPLNILVSAPADNAVSLNFHLLASCFARRERRREKIRQVRSTPYMSPEQSSSYGVDVRSDVFSLGVIFYYLLSGESLPPVNYSTQLPLSFYEGLEKSWGSEKKIPDQLRAIIVKATAIDLDQRYQTAAELVENLNGLSR